MNDIDYWDVDKCYMAMDVKITSRHIEEIYTMLIVPDYLLGPKSTNKPINKISDIVWYYDVWKEFPNEITRECKKILYCLSIRKPEIDEAVFGLYVMALKYKNLNILDSIQGITDHETLYTLMPPGMRWLDTEKIIRFYSKYTCKRYEFNKIKIPENVRIQCKVR